MLLLKLLQLRLQFLHRALGARRREGEGEEDEPDEDREHYDGDTDVRSGHERDKRDERVIERIIEERVE